MNLLSSKGRELNDRTPKWFKDWHAREFLPVKIKQSALLPIIIGLIIAVVVKLLMG